MNAPARQNPLADVEALVARLDAGRDAELTEAARALVRALLDLHRAGLERALGLVREAGAPGDALVAAFVGDERVAALLLLHDLHPTPIADRVAQAVSRAARLYEGVKLLGVAEGVVRIDLERLALGRRRAAARAVEDALAALAPDARAVSFEPSPDDAGEPLVALRRKEPGR